jgi:ABC-2 type transport system permease protein
MNFVMWRVRNVFKFFLIFYLWDAVYGEGTGELFGYDKSRMITYVFGLLIVNAFVLSAKAQEIAGEISRGDIINYFLKPVNLFKYWFTRDIASKALNFTFAVFEFSILFAIFKPDFFFQNNPLYFFGFILSVMLAILIYFFLIILTSSIPFWFPESAWGAHFLFSVIMIEFLSGSIFPINILPDVISKLILLTPFPYLIYVPIQIYLGNFSLSLMTTSLLFSIFWLLCLWKLSMNVWKRGVTAYETYGR